MMKWLRSRLFPKPEYITVHLIEWPSGREQGICRVWTDQNECAINVYGVTEYVPHYIDGAKTYSRLQKLACNECGEEYTESQLNQGFIKDESCAPCGHSWVCVEWMSANWRP